MFFHVGVQRCDIYAEGYHIIGIGCVAEKIKNFFKLLITFYDKTYTFYIEKASVYTSVTEALIWFTIS